MTKRQKILLVAIIALAFLYRLVWLDYPLINTEPQRDYLIAQHILTYQDLPKSGPCCLFNGFYAPYRHPVIYYNILSGMLAINQNFMFLMFINFFLQIIPVVAIFVLASRFFPYNAGLLAIFFYGFHQAIFKNALFFWQPHLMLPFLYGSFFALFLFYRTNKYWLLIVSILLFFIGSAIHLSSVPVAPFWLIALFFILRSQKRSIKLYLTAFLLICIGLLVMLKGVSLEIFNDPLLLIHGSIVDYGQSLVANTSVYLKSLYGNGIEISFVGIFLLILNFVFLLLYFRQRKLVQRKFYMIILIGIIAAFIAGISIFKATIWSYYLSPLFGVSIIVFAETIAVQKNRLIKAFAILWIVIFIGQFFFYYPPVIKFFSNARGIDLAANVLVKEIKDIQRQKNYPQPNFFLIKVYAQGVETPTVEDLAFWLPLEQKLQRKFIRVNNTTSSFTRLNSSYYIYVVCQSFAKKINVSKDCLEPFNKEFSGYKINRVIYEKQPFTIYEAILYPSISFKAKQPGTE